ncbi:MAG: hypothetical protein B6D58_05085 [candidate division Zixibacteria bacterium 4484_95]|mgnify:CR=1 FL=1|nr:MAG: hypothetical protein B6D58_05085 [candidate division Zixibacteria bacterium 4484_95]RKX19233.1 MAG: hypothetical protein DRP26_03785 [candidate division Zixibacteria bacterium]
MLTWCAILFCLGILAFLDSLFNYGEIFRRINSVLFMLVSLGVLVRTSMKIKMRQIEKLTARVKELEGITGQKSSEDEVIEEQKKQPVF